MLAQIFLVVYESVWSNKYSYVSNIGTLGTTIETVIDEFDLVLPEDCNINKLNSKEPYDIGTFGIGFNDIYFEDCGRIMIFMIDKDNIIDYNKLALIDYNRLNKHLKRNKGKTLKQLCSQLNGWNLDDTGEYFDLDFGCLTTTIRMIDNKIIQQSGGIQVWDIYKEEPVLYIEDLKC